jgi:hypothetical protein
MARRSTGGNASKAKAGKASQAKGRETTKTKRRVAPAATLRKRLTVSDLVSVMRSGAVRAIRTVCAGHGGLTNDLARQPARR